MAVSAATRRCKAAIQTARNLFAGTAIMAAMGFGAEKIEKTEATRLRVEHAAPAPVPRITLRARPIERIPVSVSTFERVGARDASAFRAPGLRAPRPPAESLPIPFVAQPNEFTCGPACATAVARLQGAMRRVDVRAVAAQMGTTRDGTDPAPIARYLNTLPGVKARVSHQLTLQDLRNNVAAGRLTLVCYEAYPSDPPMTNGKIDWKKVSSGHWSIVTAANARGVWLMDPYINRPKSNGRARGFIALSEFADRFLLDGSGSGIVVDVTDPKVTEHIGYSAYTR